jgi:hypothetical protein
MAVVWIASPHEHFGLARVTSEGIHDLVDQRALVVVARPTPSASILAQNASSAGLYDQSPAASAASSRGDKSTGSICLAASAL